MACSCVKIFVKARVGMREKLISHSFAVSPGLIRWLREMSVKRNISISRIVRDALFAYRKSMEGDR